RPGLGCFRLDCHRVAKNLLRAAPPRKRAVRMSVTARVARLIGHGPVGVWERAAGVCGSVLAVVPTRGVRQLEANLSRLGPVDPGLIRRNMAAYMRSFAASFALESLEGHR